MNRHVPTLCASALIAGLALGVAACQGEPDQPPPDLTYSVPLQDGAYWPKFRRTAANTGYSPVKPGGGQDKVWSLATGKGIFSAPVIDKDGTIYFGCGDGRLYALNPDGTRRWSFNTSTDDRNDLNSSPSLGKDAIYIAGEDGKLWSVPYDHCLRGGATDERCSTKPVEDMPADGAHAFFLTHGGSSLEQAAGAIGVAEPIALRLVVRKAGDTVDAALVPVLDLHRLAAPMPTMLPSYNQIGFDFMHMLVGVLELDQSSGKALAWVVAAKPSGDDVVVDPGSDQKILFPLVGQVSGDSVVFDTSSFRVEFAQVDVPIARMRIGATLDKAGADVDGLSVIGTTLCKDVEFYGTLLRVAGLCNPKTDEMVILGTALLKERGDGGKQPAGLTVETPTLIEATSAARGTISAKLGGSLPESSHLVSILLLDSATGKPYPVNYSQQTKNDVDASGKITAASLTFGEGLGITAGAVEAVVIHDLFPVARFKL